MTEPRRPINPVVAHHTECYPGAMSDDLYDRDILLWSEQQAELLRRLSRGERVNNAMDWANVIDEVETVGRSELKACESHLSQALVHLLKLHARPGSDAAPHWRGEVGTFLTGARRTFTPSMRQRLDLAECFADAVYRVGLEYPDSPAPPACPYSLDDLLAPRPDVSALLARLAPSAAKP